MKIPVSDFKAHYQLKAAESALKAMKFSEAGDSVNADRHKLEALNYERAASKL